MSILSLIKKISEEEKEDKYVLSFLKKNQSEFSISESKILKTTKINPSKKDGFIKFHFSNGKIVSKKYLEEDDSLVHDYVNSLPTISMILSRKLDDNNWIAVPRNPIESTGKGIIGSQVIHNCQNCSYFDHIICGITLDKNILFKEFDYSFDSSVTEDIRNIFLNHKEKRDFNVTFPRVSFLRSHKEAFRLALEEIKDLLRKDREQLLQTSEGRIKLALEETGARLTNLVIRSNNLAEVRWRSRGGRNYNSIIDAITLDVISAGLCLAGEDKKYDLISLVDVVAEGERRDLIHAW